MKNIHIGFDVGTTSVGWAVVDDQGKLLKFKNRYWYGVRLFEDAAEEKTGDSKNLSRRNARHLRRIIRRRALRNADYIKLIIDYGFVKNEEEFYELLKINKVNPLDLRIKGLKSKLTNSELCVALFNYLQHRGFFYDNLDGDKKEENKFEELGPQTNELLKEKHPSEIQKMDYINDGYYVGHARNAHFSNKDWKNEIEDLFKNQNLQTSLKNKYISIFTRVRDYSKGPGSEKSPSIYGLFQYDEKGDVKQRAKTLWELTTGKCWIYPSETRSIKKSGSAELFNFLNDLNNLRLRDDSEWRIDPQSKEQLLIRFLKDKPTLTRIAKILKCDSDNIYGYRIDKSKKPVIEEMENIRNVFSLLQLNDFNPWINPSKLDIVNKIVELKSKVKNKEDLKKNILTYLKKETKKPFTEDDISNLINLIKGSSSTHAFSIKFLNECIPLLFNADNGENQTNFILNKRVVNSKSIETLYINPNKALRELFVSPTSKRAIRQTIRVFNKIIKLLHKDFSLKSISIEMARDKNSKEEKDSIIAFQKLNEDRNKLIEKYIEGFKNNKDLSSSNITFNNSLSNNVRHKLYLLIQQNFRNIYNKNDAINFEEVLKYPSRFDIDHIIPYSKSFMNNKNNKVLTRKEDNQEKSDRTPYQWFLETNKLDEYNKLKLWWKDLFKNKDDREKFNNLSYELDPLEHFEDFIGRNLSDTRISSSSLLDIFQNYKRGHTKDNIQVFSINGTVTNYIRNDLRSFIPQKKRELYRHHADDALVLAYLSTNSNILKIYRYLEKIKNNKISILSNKDTGEVKFNKSEFIDEFANKYSEIDLKQNPPTFSRQINNLRTQTQFYNETIFSGKFIDDLKTIRKISKLDLLNSESSKLKKFFGDEATRQKDLFIFNNYRKLYDQLNNIYKEYCKDDNVNPFRIYYDEYKKGKNLLVYIGDSSICVRKLKYLDDKVNSYFVNSKVCHSDKYISFFDGLNNIGLRLTKNNSNFDILPVTIKNEFNKECPHSVFLPKYTSICLKNQPISKGMFYIVGRPNKKVIDIKPIMCRLDKNVNFYNDFICSDFKIRKGVQFTIRLNTLIRDFDRIITDELGNVYSRKSFDKLLTE